ncbi:MAG: N-acetylmuramoyl-L-alanine amidase, partial [Thermodesulfovibrionales bacterium]
MSSFLVKLLIALTLVVSPVTDSLAAALQERPGVTVRMGKHQGFIRFVFDMPADFVEKASVTLQQNQFILVELQAPVSFRIGSGDSVSDLSSNEKTVKIGRVGEMKLKERGCIIHIDSIDDLKSFKLQAPSRLIVDAYTQADLSGIDAFGTAPRLYLIDPGHGGYDRGIPAGEKQEKDIVLSVAAELAAAVSREGGKAFLTRKSDRQLSIRERIMLARKRRPSMLVSIHLSSREGITIYSPVTGGDPAKGRGQLGSALSVQIIGLTKRMSQTLSEELRMEVRTERLPLPLLEESGVQAV